MPIGDAAECITERQISVTNILECVHLIFSLEFHLYQEYGFIFQVISHHTRMISLIDWFSKILQSQSEVQEQNCKYIGQSFFHLSVVLTCYRQIRDTHHTGVGLILWAMSWQCLECTQFLWPPPLALHRMHDRIP